MYFDDFVRDAKLGGVIIQEKNFSYSDEASINVMKKYLEQKVIIRVNGKQLNVKLQNMNLADNEISMNLEYGRGRKPETISVKNMIMTGLYGDMSNMIMLKVNDFEEGVKLTSEMTEQTFKIK